MKKPFLDPFHSVPQTSRVRFVSTIPPDVRDFFMSLRPQKGTMQTTINLVLNWLYYECKRKGITDHTKSGLYEQLLTDTFGTDGNGRNVAIVNTGTNVENDAGATPGEGERNTNVPNVSTNIPRRGSRGKK